MMESALVGIVPRKNLWEIIKKERWYHIPVQSAPRNLPQVRYIAFYFPKVFGEELCYKVIYYGRVIGMEKKKRIELFPDETQHPRQGLDYYQIHLDRIEELPRPIPSRRWRRIVHIPTTLRRLYTAEEINDLYETSPIEEKMYRALRRRNINPERQFYVRVNNQYYCLDFCIFCKKANIDLECDGERYHILPESLTRDRLRNNELTSYGWYVLRFIGNEIRTKLNNCLRTIIRTINTLDGLQEKDTPYQQEGTPDF